MNKFTLHSLETAPEAAKPMLESTRRAWGFLPTLHATQSFRSDPAFTWIAPRNTRRATE